MRNATCLALAVTGCAQSNPDRERPDAAQRPDAALPADAASPDTPPPPPDAASECAISTGPAPALDGVDDVADYGAGQRITPGAALGGNAAALTWDASALYLSVTSDAFGAPFEPLHVYVEAATALAAAVPASGKEYSGLVPALPFSPSHLIAARRVTDSGAGGAYNGVFVPTDAWTVRATALEPGSGVFVSADERTLSIKTPWAALGGCPTRLRLAVHVVHGAIANEWKELVPDSHTPWQAPGGGYFEIDLTGPTAVAGWTLR